MRFLLNACVYSGLDCNSRMYTGQTFAQSALKAASRPERDLTTLDPVHGYGLAGDGHPILQFAD